MAITINEAPRGMGTWTALALVLGSMIGSGIFLLPASLAPLGWNSVFGWLITVAGSLCLAAIFSKLVRAMPEAGGPYIYMREAFGAAPAFAVAWAYWITMWMGNAAIAVAGVSYLSHLFPALSSPAVAVATTIAFVWMFTLLNLRGARMAGRFQLVVTLIKILPLIAIILLALWVLGSEGTTVVAPFHAADINLPSIATATTLTLWAMLGLEAATVPADKVIDPQKTIPRATMLGTGGAGLIYIFVCSAIVLMLPGATLSVSSAPFADFFDRFWGTNVGMVVAAFGAISALGALNGWVMCQAELPAALARDGLFPRWLAGKDARGVPVNAHLLSTGLLTIVLLLNMTKSTAQLFEFLILITTSVILVVYVGCALAAGWLMRQGRLPRSAAFALIVAGGVLYGAWTVVGAGFEALSWAAVLLAAGVPVYLIKRKATA